MRGEGHVGLPPTARGTTIAVFRADEDISTLLLALRRLTSEARSADTSAT